MLFMVKLKLNKIFMKIFKKFSRLVTAAHNRFFIPESPRWLLCKGRIAEVKAIIQKACKLNGKEVPANIDALLKPSTQEEATKCITLFRSKYLLLITICFFVVWLTMNTVYYGIMLNMDEFGGNVYVNSVISFVTANSNILNFLYFTAFIERRLLLVWSKLLPLSSPYSW